MPPSLRSRAIVKDNDNIRLRSKMRGGIEFLLQYIRDAAPTDRFDLILCRNLAFTHFAMPQQRDVLDLLAGKLNALGSLVPGSHQILPPDHVAFEPALGTRRIRRLIGVTST